MEGSVAGVRILPAVVQFHDAEPGVLHQMNLKVQNLSKFSKSVRFHAPDSKFFSVKVKNPDKPIAPGLDVTALVEYYTDHAEDKQDRAILLVDNDIIEIPLIAFTPSPQLEIRGPVNFGSTVADGKVLTGYFSIDNYGSKAGEFKIKYTGKQPITLSPTSGVVEAETSQKIKVEFISKTCGKVQEIVNVKLEGQEPAHTEILANVVERNIQLLNPESRAEVEHIQFGPTYYGTDQLQSFLLSNNGPDKINFVVLLDEDSEGQEVGLDLTKNATAALMSSQTRFQSDNGDDGEDLTSLISVFPNQGTLASGQSIELFFKFSPRFQKSNLGWKSSEELAPRKDYALFINIEAVGIINKNEEGAFKHGCKREIAVSGTAVPVDITVNPGAKFLFGKCDVGDHIDALCSIKNNSALLPTTFVTKALAHFHPKPCKAALRPLHSSDIMISFRPKQMGTFVSKLELSFMGAILDPDTTPSTKTQVVYKQVVIHTLYLQLHGVCNGPGSSTSRHVVGLPSSVSSPRAGDVRQSKDGYEIAKPNDRATSIRPAERNSKIRTQFTEIQRYSYIDPDFALSDEETRRKQQHKQLYLNYIRDSRNFRDVKSSKNEMDKWENNKDLGMKPAHGLPPPKLSANEAITPESEAEKKRSGVDGLLSTKSLATPENIVEGLNAVPLTDLEKLDCNKTLTPQEIKKIEITSALIDFGEVCQRSVKTEYLTINNNLDHYIHVVVNIDCRELRQSSPLSQVIPPFSTARINLLFESNSKGSFERSIKYTINERHQFHVVARAQVVSVALELSCEEIILKPAASMAAESGFRGVVTISNKRNAAGDFSWKIVNGEDGTSFSIRPSKGTVEAFSSLDCEVVFYPSFGCSRRTQFALHVDGGNLSKLLCQAEFGPAQCSFVERRFVFGFVPLHLTTVRKCHLKNTGSNHAYFQVSNARPLAGMVISPKQGVVPVGGTTEIKVEFTPDLAHKFDSEIEVNILGWKTISLRMGGTVEQPCVDVDVRALQFHGVYCDATAKLPFKLSNKARSKAKVVFDLSRYRDFSLVFHDDKDESFENDEGLFTTSLPALETLDCVLTFKPTEVASYNFILPVTINDTMAPSPTPSSMPSSPAPSNTNWTIPELDTPPPIPVSIATPSRRVLATALRPPLQLSHSHLKFSLPAGYYDLGVQSDAGRVQTCILVNNNKLCKWSVDISSSFSLFEEGIFTFVRRSGSPFPSPRRSSPNVHAPNGTLQCGETSQLGVMFSPKQPGMYRASVPLILNDDHNNAYRVLELEGELLAAEIKFEPKTIDFKVVPLAIENSMEFEIIAKGYRKSCDIHLELPEVEMNDGSRMCLLSTTFPKGTKINPCYSDDPQQESCRIPCKLTFRSPKPVSFATEIKFTVNNERFFLQVSATADNCLLTNYPFLALHRNDYHIVCEQKPEMMTNGDDNTSISTEVFLLPCITPNRPVTYGSTGATSTTFCVSSSSYEDSSDPSSSLRDTPSPVEGMVHNGITRHQELEFVAELSSRDLIGGDSPEELIFFKEVLKALQRWISLQAWSSGPYPIKIPKYFQDSFETIEDFTVSGQGGWNGRLHKDTRTIFQLVAHLCGRHIPGIPVNFSFPSDRCDRVRKLHWMYSALLIFLRAQGALLAHVSPEDLMSYSDYCDWKGMEREQSCDRVVKSRDRDSERVKYERISCRAWTDLLLQLLKVFVLGRVTPQQFKKISYPPGDSGPPFINPDPLSSNIYSVGERILLAWFNHHYKEQKQKTWALNRSLPSARWIVNFDLNFMDGLVLAAVLAAHCPFLVESHLRNMFLHPTTAEKCLHNAVQVVEAFKMIHLDYDVVATDITEANPVSILLLCLHLYQHLPQYIPRTTVDFTGSLHATITKHVQLQNPSSSKPLFYRAILLGQDASDFTVPMGDMIQVSPKGQVQLPVEFKSRFLRPCTATLVLVGKRAGSATGCTLVFNLRTSVDNITPSATIKCESPLYEINKVDLDISNPFPHEGKFRVVLVEARGQLANNASKEKRVKSKTIKKVESKTDHGQSRKQKSSKKDLIVPVTPEKKNDPQILPENLALTRAFWCSDDNIHLDANGSARIEINFVPFQVGNRQCSVLLINEEIGEFLYLIETETTVPLPCRVPYVPSAHSVRVSSSLAAHHGRGIYGGDDRVLYWKCECSETFTENIVISRTNLAKENALAVIGQKNMSKKELRRRELTNTLDITSITSAMTLLGLAPDYYPNMVEERGFKTSSSCIAFKVESSSKYFSVPATLKIPLDSPSTIDIGVAFPVQFTAEEPGHYPCQITLKSVNDIRVYQIECTVSPVGLDTELEFTTPLHQSVTQEVPVVNQTKQDWQLIASVEGEGFHGPPVMVAKACVTSYYPLMFRPTREDCVKGRLALTNAQDGSEQMYRLKGLGDPPAAMEHIVIECEARKKTVHSVQLPMTTRKRKDFKVVSDLGIITGSPYVSCIASIPTNYQLTVLPWRRGVFNGVISFVESQLPGAKSTSRVSRTDDSDTSEDEQDSPSFQSSSGYTGSEPANSEPVKPYRFWYSIEIRSSPPPPEKVLDVSCAVLSAVGIEITVSNPSEEQVVMNVIVEGQSLHGESVLVLGPKQQTLYQATYRPVVIGMEQGSIIFQHEIIGEFWYKLNLLAEQPEPEHLPNIDSELGSHSHQMIQLENPTDQTLTLTPYSSNQRNFALEVDTSKQLFIVPHGVIQVPLRFTPSQIGLGKHKARIVFRSEQLGDWTFVASGTGLNPKPTKPIYVHGKLSENSSVIVPFRNPTEHTVVVDVNLREKSMHSGSVFLSGVSSDNSSELSFCLLLKRNDGILLRPQEILDIPVTFSPHCMKSYEATVTVSIQRYDIAPGTSYSDILPTTMINNLSWIFPLKGIPVSHVMSTSRAITIECQSRDRTEQMVELTLSGVVPSGRIGSLYTGDVTTPISLVKEDSLNDAKMGVDNVPYSESFNYEFLYEDNDCQNALERSLGIQLEKKYRNKASGVVTLIFRLIFSPYKPFNHVVHLVISAGSGGVWKFPIRFLATDAEVDDTITIEAVGLNKAAVVGFRLNSQCRQAVPFTASLTADSDKEFALYCSSELLLPQDSEGTLIKVTYKPTLYGKTHKAKIIVQTADMQWTYDIKGVNPEYVPPSGQSVITTKQMTYVKQRKKNYIRDNLRLQATGVSSPIKGAPIVQRGRRNFKT